MAAASTSSDAGKRLFGSALAKVQKQDAPAASPQASQPAGVAVQVPAKDARRSIFERMDVVPEAIRRQRDSAWSDEEGSGRPTPGSGGAKTRNVYALNGSRGGRGGNFSRRDFEPVRRVRSSGDRFGRPYNEPPSEGRWKNDRHKTPPANNPGSVVFVRNIPQGLNQRQLVTLFSQVGDVVAIKLDKGPLPTASVSFLRRESAGEAVTKLHGTLVWGNKLKITEVVQQEKSAEGEGRGEDSVKEAKSRGGGGTESRDVGFDRPNVSVFDRLH